MTLSVLDGAGEQTNVKTTVAADIHTPHSIIDSSALPSGAATQTTLAACATHLSNILAALTITDAYVNNVASASTNPVTFGSVAVKAPVTITIDNGMTGTLTVDDGDAGAVVLRWDTVTGKHYPSHVFHVANLNQLRYTFSVHAGTETFSVSSAT